MSATEIRTLARVVVEAGGDLNDLRRLVRLWEARDPRLWEARDPQRPPIAPVAPCSCQTREREWRLRRPGLDVTYGYVSGKAFRAAAAQPATDRRGLVAKGPASGWVWEATLSEHEHAWQCSLCHSPAKGLDTETRERAA